jgi:hypothetical protein
VIRNHLINRGARRRLLSQPGIVPRIRSDRNFRIPDLGAEAELLRRGTDGNWPEQPLILFGADTLTLNSIGSSTPLAALYRTTALAS